MKYKDAVLKIKQSLASIIKSSLSPVDNRGWHTVLESFRGAWQADIEINTDTVLAQTAVFSCITLIASDIAKLRLHLKELNQDGIWDSVTIPAYSHVLKKPNHYQTRQQFIETWVLSKLIYGNTYVLKQRDRRNVVTALYVLDANLVKPLVAENGDVFYQLQDDKLSRIYETYPAIPASEIIHDRMNTLFHPLVGLSPIFSSGLAATQGLKIQQNSAKFFQNMSRPSGMLTAPTEIKDSTAVRLKKSFEENFSGQNIGRLFVAGDGLTYTAMTVTPLDAQLVEQLKMSSEQVCSTFHVPAYMVGVGQMPGYDNLENLTQGYYGQCLQSHIESIEALLDEGLGLDAIKNKTVGVEFELDDLFKMDSSKRIEMLSKGIGSAIFAPNEARKKLNLSPMVGGESPYLQQQNYSLAALAERDENDPFSKPEPSAIEPTEESTEDEVSEDEEIEEATLSLIASIKKGLSNEV